MRRYYSRKAYTLIELVVAIAITSIIVAVSGSLISRAIRMRQMADAQADMYMTSLRVHKAIAAELSASQDIILYKTTINNFNSVNVTNERVIWLASKTENGYTKGQVYLSNKSNAKKELLPTTNGFDSYNGVTVTDMSFKLTSVYDHKSSNDVNATSIYRCLTVSTTVEKDGWTYTHSSTIRFDEMILEGKTIMISSSTSTYDKSFSRAAQSGDSTATYKAIRYSLD
jgi:prepilin-type N-terminal cleavage/methylation domain-containing protein